MNASNELVRVCATTPELRDVQDLQDELEGQELKDSLQRRSKKNPYAKAFTPKELKLGSITIKAGLFQLRTMLSFQSENHVRFLIKTPKEGRPLAPLLVWWAGDGWVLVDGHHRVEAYKAAQWGNEVEVPVECLVGSLDDAMLKAAASNCRPVLQMDRKERMTAAWRLTLYLDKSKVELASAAAVSTSTIAKMRAVLKKLQERDLEEFPIPLEWGAALMQARGATVEETDWEKKEDLIVKEYAVVLLKVFGSTPNHKKSLFARAIELYDCQIADEVLRNSSLERLKERYEERKKDAEMDYGF